MAPNSAERDPLRDADARIRALVREVGVVREELRRETKRRERAVVQVDEGAVSCMSKAVVDWLLHTPQAKEAQEGRSGLEQKVQELGCVFLQLPQH